MEIEKLYGFMHGKNTKSKSVIKTREYLLYIIESGRQQKMLQMISSLFDLALRKRSNFFHIMHCCKNE